MNTTETTAIEPTTTKSNRGRKKGTPNAMFYIPLGEFARIKLSTVPVPKKLAIQLFGSDVAKIAMHEPVAATTAAPKASSIGVTVIE